MVVVVAVVVIVLVVVVAIVSVILLEVEVVVTIFDKDNNPVAPTPIAPVEVSPSQYYYDFTPLLAGEYKITFVGELSTPSPRSITVSQVLYVSTPTDEYRPTITLRADEIIAFAPNIAPLYIDPESIRVYFPDAPLLEIGELVHGP